MGFVKKDNGSVVWKTPNETEAKKLRDEIFDEQSREIQLTEDLKKRIDDAIRNANPNRVNYQLLATANENVYKTVGAVIRTPSPVDIVLPIHNAIHIAKQCIESVLARTYWPYHLYIVDDASDSYTNGVLIKLAQKHENITLLVNRKNQGFAATVNRGIRTGNSPYVCLLNSDVIVSKYWLLKMMMAHFADERNQIVCPTTNNTAIVNVPMSPGASYLQMNRVLQSYAMRRYPEIMPTGFCMSFSRQLIEQIGYFDEAYVSYGEDTDFWWRCINYMENQKFKKYRAVLADDAYVFHERSSSFSHMTDHMALRRQSADRFHRLWPAFRGWEKAFRPKIQQTMAGLRETIPPALLHDPDACYAVCYVVHSAEHCGGMRYIADIVNEINERGHDARVAVIKRDDKPAPEPLSELRSAPVYFESYEDFVRNFQARVFPCGVVIAATVELAPAVQTVCELCRDLKPMLHAQSYEVDMVVGSEAKGRARNLFRLIPNIISNSQWITNALAAESINVAATIPPGVDSDLFYPRGREKGDDRPTLLISLNKHYNFKGYGRGLALLQEVQRLANEQRLDIRLMVYGVESVPNVNSVVCLGPIPPIRIAKTLGTEVDVFVDPSHIHSYGMPALEAVAGGVKVFCWDNKGVREYADERVTVVPNDTDPTALAAQIVEYLKNPKAHSHSLPRKHIRKESVNNFIKTMEKLFNLEIVSRRIVVVVPHLRKHGGPTTMLAIANELAKNGHRVSIKSFYDDVNSEVAAMTNLPIDVDNKKVERCDLIITNSDNPLVKGISMQTMAKKIMLKLSHNARFKGAEELGLQCEWDAIVTSSQWLKDVCENPTEGWNYPPRGAVRIGWWHYTHHIFRRPPAERNYADGVEAPIRIGTLVHNHPSKGSLDAVKILGEISSTFGNRVHFVGVGEVPRGDFDVNLPNFHYAYAPSREEMAALLASCDIWLGASRTEGLGRMGLEAMSAGCAAVLTATTPEYVRDEVNALLYPIGDITSGVKQISLLIEDPALAARIRQEGFLTAEAATNPKSCMDALEEVIKGVFA